MQKYCRKMKKRRVNFSLLRANEVGNTETLLSNLWASVVKICTFGCRPHGQGRRIKLNFPSTACLSSPHSILLSVVLD